MDLVTLKTSGLRSSFANDESFRPVAANGYTLLPLRFLRLDASRYISTNLVGEYALLSDAQLKGLVSHRLRPTDGIYEELKSKHFLFDGDSSVAVDLLACKYRTKQSYLARLTSLFMFVVTLRCEHSCPYCQVSRQTPDRSAFDMTREHAARAIDMVFESPSSTIKIEFQGGEPLLNFELIRWIIEEVKGRNEAEQRDLSFVIATNLALITDEILEYCAANAVAISTSLDGPRDLHNANRPRVGHDSHEKTVAGIQRVREKLGQDAVAALVTTTRASLVQPEAIVDEYVRLGFSSMFLRPLSPFGFAVRSASSIGYAIGEWITFYKQAIDHILRLNKQGIVFREEYAALLLRKILTPFPVGYVDLQSPAGMGISCLAFNYDGGIHASDEARMLAAIGDQSFKLGELSESTLADVLLSDRLQQVLDATFTESMPMCSDCGIQPFCGSDPVHHFAAQGDMVGRKYESDHCQKNMEIIKYLIRKLEDEPESAAILRRWAV